MFSIANSYRLIGLLFWVGIFACTAIVNRSRQPAEISDPPIKLSEYFFTTPVQFEAVDVSRVLRSGDPVFQQDTHGQWTQIGHVETLDDATQGAVNVTWYADSSPDGFSLVSHYSRGSMEEVIATMLPEAKRQQIQRRLADVLKAHGEELSGAFTPLVQDSLRQSMPLIENEFRKSVERHRGEVDQLAGRWNDEVVKDRLIPMARREILPIVRKHGAPTAERMGRELWDRASVWRFGWRIVYDRSPLPEKNLVQEEWDRFVEDEAVPVFDEHMDEIVVSVQRILSDVAANPSVRGELSAVSSELVNDPEARELVRTVLKETLVENERLRQAWRDVWTSPEAQAALTMAADRLEPVVRGIGDDLFGTEEGGIDPNFARVLRNQILGKDRRWVTTTPQRSTADETTNRTITRATDFMAYPLVYMADRDTTGDPTP
ncbi:MAG: hypothetical protein P8L85_07000 [Rubripirellula sp.]|nr:hypothetical protein [Rubripirellula sp.]